MFGLPLAYTPSQKPAFMPVVRLEVTATAAAVAVAADSIGLENRVASALLRTCGGWGMVGATDLLKKVKESADSWGDGRPSSCVTFFTGDTQSWITITRPGEPGNFLAVRRGSPRQEGGCVLHAATPVDEDGFFLGVVARKLAQLGLAHEFCLVAEAQAGGYYRLPKEWEPQWVRLDYWGV